MNQLRADALACCMVLIAYVFGAFVSIQLADRADVGVVFWVPAGITSAAVLLSPLRRWPAIAIAIAIAEVFTKTQFTSYSTLAIVGSVAAHVAQPFVGAAVVLRLHGRLDLSRRDDLRAFAIGAVTVGPLIAALIGASTVSFDGGSFVDTFVSWWIGDGLGVILIASLILSVATIPSGWSTSPFELVIGLSLTAATAIVLHWISDLPIGFLAVIPVVTISARSGTWLASIASNLVAGIALVAWFIDGTTIAGMSMDTGTKVAQLQLLCVTAAALLVAAESSEREDLSRRSGYQIETVRQLREALAPESVIRTEHVLAEGISESASDRLEVGGDWYDIFEGDNGQVSIIIGDVVGHSESAVVGMGRMRSAAAALAMRTSDTGLVLDWLDEYARSTEDRPYATAFFARFDPVAKTLTYSTAGHPPALLGQDDGSWEWLFRGRSTPIGVPFPQARPSATVQLEGSCTLIVYTDGAVERAGEVIDTGLARVFDAVTRRPNASVDQLLHEVTEQTVRDDASFVRVRLRC